MAYYSRQQQSRQPTHADAEVAIGELVSTLQVRMCKNEGGMHMQKLSIIQMQRKLSSSTHPRIRVSEIVKAGSMGHGTIVPGSFDIDLVLYSQGKQICVYIE